MFDEFIVIVVYVHEYFLTHLTLNITYMSFYGSGLQVPWDHRRDMSYYHRVPVHSVGKTRTGKKTCDGSLRVALGGLFALPRLHLLMNSCTRSM